MPDYISAALEETEEPGVHVKETINNGYKWTLELILWSRGFALKGVKMLTNG